MSKCRADEISIGDKFGSLTVIEKDAGKITCRCDCGNVKITTPRNLLSGHAKHCSKGCYYARLDKLTPMKGMRFGKLVVISDGVDMARKKDAHFCHCKCDCGNEVILYAHTLTRGSATACRSCYSREVGSTRTHAMSDTRFYHIWCGMVQRCNNPNNPAYSKYGGRGIRILWKSFEDFRDDMYSEYLAHIAKYGIRNTSINRIDNDWHYCFDNCEWATDLEQARNKTTTRRYEFRGGHYAVGELCEMFNESNYNTLWHRINDYGCSVEYTYNRWYKEDVNSNNE